MPTPYYDAARDELVMIPGYRHIVVNRNLLCLNLKTRRQIKTDSKQSGARPFITVGDRKYIAKSLPLRLLVAAAFIPVPMGYMLPRDYDKLDVLQIDNDVSNLELDNLRWVVKPDIAYLLTNSAWADQIFLVPSTSGLAISKSGAIYNTQSGKRLSTFFNSENGYLYVSSKIDGVRKNHLVHRLIGEMFVPPKLGYTIERCVAELVINHKDFDRLNNTPDNLEWVTQLENVNHGMINSSVPIRLRIKEIDGFNVVDTASIVDLSERLSVKTGLIRGLLNAGILARISIQDHVIASDNEPFLDNSVFASSADPYYTFCWANQVTLKARVSDMILFAPGMMKTLLREGISGLTGKTYRKWIVSR